MQSLKLAIKYFWPIIKNYKMTFFYSFFAFGVAITIKSVIKPIFLKEIIDVVTAAQPSPEIATALFKIIILIIIVTAVAHFFFRTLDYAMAYSFSHVTREINNLSFAKLTAHSHKFFANNFAGSLVAKMRRYTRAFDIMYNVTIWRFWGLIVRLTGTFTVLFIANWILGLLFFGWTIIYILITLWFVKKKRPLDLADAAADSLVTARIADVITNIIPMKLFSGNRKEYREFTKVTFAESVARLKMWYFANLQMLVQGILLAVLEIVGIYLAIKLWLAGSISAGMVALVQVYVMSMFHPMWELGKAIQRFGKALADTDEMTKIFEQPLEISDPAKPEKNRINSGAIAFSDVAFSYVDTSAILKNFNLTIPAGQKVGLVGTSGAGKSTITKLLLRFADVQDGAITIDGQDIRNITQDALRSSIAYVPQEPLLFHRPIIENIGYGRPSAKKSEVLEASRKAHADVFIENLPKKYQTLVGERGIKLSGGERQRVAIARAILKQAPILVLDEATSSLDSVSERLIQDALHELMQNKTAIVIAHRLSTIQQMDRIIVLEEGEIVEDGTHAELLAKQGTYYNLWQHQSEGFLKD